MGTPACYFDTEEVIVVTFDNCVPTPNDWIGIYASGTPTRYVEATQVEWIGQDFIDWAFTCGEQDRQQCNTTTTTTTTTSSSSSSSSSFSFAFATNTNTDYDRFNLKAYLLRGPALNRGLPYEILAQSDSLITTQMCRRP